jgi:putative serine protease PepD
MPRLSSKKTLLAAVAGAAVLGAAGGAGIYSAVSSSGGTTTVVRQVPVESPSPASSQSGLSVNQIYRLAHRGVVEITVVVGRSSPFPGGQQESAQGSGFVYDKQGHIVTNQHVVDGSTSIRVRFWNGAEYKARLVGSDRSTDVAVIQVAAPSSLLEPLKLGDSSAVQVGDGVVAIGSPFGLEETVTTGIVSALHRQPTSPNNYAINDSIQTDAAINHGNSGGPLLDLAGRVIGINSQIAGDSGGNEGVGFAVPSNTVRSVVSQLIATGRAKHAFLGVSLQTVPASAAGRLGLVAGVEIGEVKAGTPAAGAGLHGSTGSKFVDGEQYSTGGDVITAIDGRKVTSALDVQSIINGKEPGDRIQLTYVRNGQTRTVAVTLGNRPS